MLDTMPLISPKNTLIVILSLLIFCFSKVQANFYYDVASFCKNNGLNYLTISSLPHLNNATHQLIREINQHYVPFRQLSFDKIRGDYEMHQDSLLLMAESDLLNDQQEPNHSLVYFDGKIIIIKT